MKPSTRTLAAMMFPTGASGLRLAVWMWEKGAIRLSPILTAAFVTTLVTASANGGFILQTETFDGHTYHLVGADSNGNSINWTDSETFANTLDSHLVTIESQAENDFLFNTFGAVNFTGRAVNRLWIGLSDQAMEGTFVWSSGAPLTYTNWGNGEPNNAGDEDFVYIRTASSLAGPNTWNDDSNVVIGANYGMVEVVSEPAGPPFGGPPFEPPGPPFDLPGPPFDLPGPPFAPPGPPTAMPPFDLLLGPPGASVLAVPEPSALSLAAIGFIVLFGYSRRRRDAR